MRAALFLVVLFTTTAILPLGGQQPQGTQKQPTPTFRVRVEYVEVDAVVEDGGGHFVADLKKNDFEVFEDGKKQDVVGFDLMDVPVEAPPMVALVTRQTLEPDVVSNAQPPGRVYLIVIDNLHINSARTVAARRIAREFIEKMAPNDVAAVVQTAGKRGNAQDFTSNKRLLLAAVDRSVGMKMLSPGAASVSNTLTAEDPNAANADTRTSPRVQTTTTVDPGARERVFNGRSSLQTLAQLATYLGGIHNRRKAMLLIGEGIDYDLGQAGTPPVAPSYGSGTDSSAQTKPALGLVDQSRALRDDLRAFVNAANRANVTLYAIDPRVFTHGGDDFVDIAAGRMSDIKNGWEVTNTGTLEDDISVAQNNLRDMSGQTGGFAVTGSLAALAQGYERIRNECSHYYILGYYPTNVKADGKFRRIEVRIKRPGLRVQNRKGYVAAKNDKATATVETKEGTSAPMREALNSPLGTVGVPMTAVSAPFKGANGNASVLVMLQTLPGALKFVESNGRAEGNLEVSFVAMDYQNKTRGGERLELTMPLKPETASVVDRTGLLVQSRVSLPPGRYVLRVGVRDANADKVGSVHCDVEVPDYEKLPLSMSGIVMASTQSGAVNPRPDKELGRALGDSTPSVIREFTQTDEMSMLAEIYDTKMATPHDLDIVSTVLSEDGREVFRREEKRNTAEIGGTPGGFGYLLKVPLANFAPGMYLLRLEVRSRIAPDTTAERQATFKVVR